jgi:putative transposase
MNIRRYYVPGAVVFITQVVHNREPLFADEVCVALLRSILHRAKVLYPFNMLAYIFLPDHLHLMIVPSGCTHSQIMHSLKPNFTKAYKQERGITGSLVLWQRRYYDHVIRDDIDFQRHMDYIHFNPVAHGLASKPEAWQHSSFVYWQQRGFYPARWGWSLPDSLAGLTDRME